MKAKLEKIADTISASSLPENIWVDLIARIRYITMFYQTAHWVSKGSSYYGDHELFGRLYDESNEEIDGIAERAIGTTGEECVDLTQSLEKMMEFNFDYTQDMISGAITLNERLIELLELIDSGDGHSSGTRGMLNEISSVHETHLYLLKQRNKELFE